MTSTPAAASNDHGADAVSVQDVAAIETVLRRYADLTNAGDASAVSTEMYRAPILLATPDGEHTVFADSAALAAGFQDYLEQEKQAGRIRSDIDRIRIRLQTKGLALAFVDYVNVETGGSSRDGWVYMFQKASGSWRAISAAPRDVRA